MPRSPDSTNILLQGSNNGELDARAELIKRACKRFEHLTHYMLRRQFPGLKRWEDTGDVLQNAMMRLHHSLQHVQLESDRHFYGLAAKQIRRELVDLARHYFGPTGIGANHDSVCEDSPALASSERADAHACPVNLVEWTEFHEKVCLLDPAEREVFDLLWYQQLSQPEAAVLLGVSLKTVKRRWQEAKISIYQLTRGNCPE